MLMSTRGEPGTGKWSVIVKDTEVNANNGTFDDWKLSLWGECIDASSQGLLPMPTEDDDDDEEFISAHVTTTTHASGPASTGVSANPSDHVDRPVNAKPTPTASEVSAGDSTSPTATPSATPTSTDKFLHYFPTFGVSKRTQIWIYGALAIIVSFCAGLGLYFYLQRKKRSHEDYEFDRLDSSDDADAVVNGREKGKRVKKRAGELYDAFAGESDEELLSDGEDEAYRDKDRFDDDDDDDGREDLEERGRTHLRDGGGDGGGALG